MPLPFASSHPPPPQLTNFISAERPAPLRGGILADDMVRAPAARGSAAAAFRARAACWALANLHASPFSRSQPLHPNSPLLTPQGLGKTLEVISLIATNRPGAPPPQFFTEAVEAAAAAAFAAAGGAAGAGPGGSGGGATGAHAAAEEEGGERPKKRQRKGKEKVWGAAAGGKAAGSKAAGGKKPSKLEAEAAERAAAEEPPAAPPAADGPRGTLIVCPLSVLSNWTMQLEEHTAGNLKGALAWQRGLRRQPAQPAWLDAGSTASVLRA